jgi:ABC-type transporter Mla maintaining outer membrane lipid asymmetry ATPase subunit MlaF
MTTPLPTAIAPASAAGRGSSFVGSRAGEPVAALVAAGRRFGDVIALDDISLAVVPGSLVGIIGPSGAGKTTIVRLLTGGCA